MQRVSWIIVWVLILVGCGAHTQAPRSIDELRKRAARAPQEKSAQEQLALAEVLGAEGERKNVGPQLARALTLAPNSARLWFALGIDHDSHGRPAPALDAYLHALDLAPAQGDPIAPQLEELLVHAIAGLEGSVAGYLDKVEPRFLRLLDEPGLGSPARSALGQGLI